MGLCSEEEKKAVEEWFETLENPSMGLTTIKSPRANKERIWTKLSHDLPELQKRIGLKKARNIILFNKIARYAAAACIFFACFFAGRLSTVAGYANPVANNQQKDLLYVYGENGSYAQIEGEKYDVLFNGWLKLFNGSGKPKVISSGSIEYQLEPFETILLTGSHHDPAVISQPLDVSRFRNLKGDFSVKVVRDQP